MDTLMDQKHGHAAKRSTERREGLPPHPLSYKKLRAGVLYNPYYPLYQESPPSSSRHYVEHLHLNTSAEAYGPYEQLSAGILYNPSSASHEVDPPSWPNHGGENVLPSTPEYDSHTGYYPSSPTHPFNTTQDPSYRLSHSAGHEGQHHPSHHTAASGQSVKQAPAKESSDSSTTVHGSTKGESPRDDEMHEHHLQTQLPAESFHPPSSMYLGQEEPMQRRSVHWSASTMNHRQPSRSNSSSYPKEGYYALIPPITHLHPSRTSTISAVSRQPSTSHPRNANGPASSPSVHPHPSQSSTISHQSSVHPNQLDGPTSNPSIQLHPSRASTISHSSTSRSHSDQKHANGPMNSHSRVYLHPSRASTHTITQHSHPSLHPKHGNNTPAPSTAHFRPSRAPSAVNRSNASMHRNQGNDTPIDTGSVYLSDIHRAA
ncbi:hypothetical protein BDZ97DRAFT_65670 [Flammula alnicola]|nr:hypothetical protein BDZ97DRAFT_65670 [Flammula alnicola]